MESEYKSWTLEEIATAWDERALRINPEYQRGRVWTDRQQQLLMDSVLRGYPLPRFYVHLKLQTALGKKNESYEVIDGQQRIVAMARYLKDEYELPDPADKRNALPRAIREQPCPWAKRTCSQLDPEHHKQLTKTQLSIVVIPGRVTDDEVRDLFIRLQSGTALTRQQVRDALPGGIAPLVERLAGRLTRRPQFPVFSYVDKRGVKSGEESDEGEDPYLTDRQTCAQLLSCFLDLRETSRLVSPTTQRLDNMYHQHADLASDDVDGELFAKLIGFCTKVFVSRGRTASKVRKVRLFSLFLLLYQMHFAQVPIERHLNAIANAYWDALDAGLEEPTGGRAVAAGSVAAHFAWLEGQIRERIGDEVTGLDSRRLFSEDDKRAIWERAKGICEICRAQVEPDDAEYDHIRAWALGGRTEISNGRLVHKACHRRGRNALGVIVQPTAP